MCSTVSKKNCHDRRQIADGRQQQRHEDAMTKSVAVCKQPSVFFQTPGSAADDPEGQKLMKCVPKNICYKKPLLMDKAYEGHACRAKAKQCGMCPVVPPKSNRKKPCKYDKELYKERNIVERNFRKIKEFRRIFTRYDK